MKNINARLMLSLVSSCVLIASIVSPPALAKDPFTGRVIVEWMTGNTPERDMRLVEPFAFTDAKGKTWTVPEGTIINGASIPSALWSVVGSPYTGNYRRASVVHDYYCDTKSESWQSVHRMFYDAMLAGGVSEIQAKTFYAAVYAGGPRWEAIVSKNFEGETETLIVPQQATISPSTQEETNEWIRSTNPSLDSIDTHLNARVVVH